MFQKKSTSSPSKHSLIVICEPYITVPIYSCSFHTISVLPHAQCEMSVFIGLPRILKNWNKLTSGNNLKDTRIDLTSNGVIGPTCQGPIIPFRSHNVNQFVDRFIQKWKIVDHRVTFFTAAELPRNGQIGRIGHHVTSDPQDFFQWPADYCHLVSRTYRRDCKKKKIRVKTEDISKKNQEILLKKICENFEQNLLRYRVKCWTNIGKISKFFPLKSFESFFNQFLRSLQYVFYSLKIIDSCTHTQCAGNGQIWFGIFGFSGFYHFEHFCRSKTNFSTKFDRDTLLKVFLHFKLV